VVALGDPVQQRAQRPLAPDDRRHRQAAGHEGQRALLQRDRALLELGVQLARRAHGLHRPARPAVHGRHRGEDRQAPAVALGQRDRGLQRPPGGGRLVQPDQDAAEHGLTPFRLLP
jgi:hypothetical protein